MEKKFTFTQISNRIDELYDYLEQRKLKLGKEGDSIEDLFQIYDEVGDLDRKLSKLRTSFNKSVVDVVDEKQKQVTFQYVLGCKDPAQLSKFVNRVQQLNNDLHNRGNADTLLSDVQSSENVDGDTPTA